MKPLKGDQQLRPYPCCTLCALQALEPKILSTKKKGLDASNDRGLTERSGEVFLLDILSHRMSVMAILRQVSRGDTANSTAVNSTAVNSTAVIDLHSHPA